jgi:hypothetical protein
MDVLSLSLSLNNPGILGDYQAGPYILSTAKVMVLQRNKYKPTTKPIKSCVLMARLWLWLPQYKLF